MSDLSDRRSRHDRFHQRARREGYVARSVYKLAEIDQAQHLLGPGDRVLDLGCRPGSWLQYSAERVGPRGALVGVDREPIDVVIPRARVLVADIFEVPPEELLAELAAAGADATAFDVVLSDMAPDTIGVRHADQARSEALFERALELAEALLAPGGRFVAKLFQGPGFPELIARCRRDFSRVKIVKPEGSRTRSIEQYIAGLGRVR